MDSHPQVTAGQIWKENDPRQERYICVLCVQDYFTNGHATALVQRCDAEGKPISHRKGSARIDRFNGKRSGYSFTGVVI